MDYQTKTSLILPFKGTLMVSNGGRTPETNNHNRPAEQGPQSMLYAYDFRLQHEETNKRLEEYEVFGKEVLAPANGKIIQVISGAIDVMPGERDRGVGVGNAIITDYGNGEFSLICHLKYNSIKVNVGDTVKQGEIIGLCGNTGNTSEPHIHFHLQDGPFMHKANALPTQFRKIIVNGELKENYEPIRGDMVANEAL
jgi:hypothetical protein